MQNYADTGRMDYNFVASGFFLLVSWRCRLVDHVARLVASPASFIHTLSCSVQPRPLATINTPSVSGSCRIPMVADLLSSLAHVLPDSFQKRPCWLSSPWLHIIIRPRLLATPITTSPAQMTMVLMALQRRNRLLVPLVPGALLQVLRNVAVGSPVVPFGASIWASREIWIRPRDWARYVSFSLFRFVLDIYIGVALSLVLCCCPLRCRLV